MAQENNDSKWKGQTSLELKKITATQIWPIFEDFCNIHKYVPSLDSDKCRHVKGEYGKPGLERYCAFIVETPTTPMKWANEKLVSMDPVQRSLSFEIKENNIGFKSYVNEMKVMDIDGGCRIEFSFMADPIEGWSLGGLSSILESNLKAMAEMMEKDLQAATN